MLSAYPSLGSMPGGGGASGPAVARAVRARIASITCARASCLTSWAANGNRLRSSLHRQRSASTSVGSRPDRIRDGTPSTSRGPVSAAVDVPCGTNQRPRSRTWIGPVARTVDRPVGGRYTPPEYADARCPVPESRHHPLGGGDSVVLLQLPHAAGRGCGVPHGFVLGRRACSRDDELARGPRPARPRLLSGELCDEERDLRPRATVRSVGPAAGLLMRQERREDALGREACPGTAGPGCCRGSRMGPTARAPAS